MADSDKRLRYYNGQFLREQDFNDEQEYHLDRQRRHNRHLHFFGIAEGLTVTAEVGATSATVSPGTAIDSEGRMIVLTDSRTVQLGSLTGSVLVVISYSEQPSDPATVGDDGDTRWWEHPDIEAIAETNAPAADLHIRLARLQLAADGKVSQHDTTVRSSTGKLSVGSLKVQNALGGSPQFVQDQNGNHSRLALGKDTHVGINTTTPDCMLTVHGNIQAAPLVEVQNQDNEASIRYATMKDGAAWHVGLGGIGGEGNFFFWNDTNKTVATITPEGNTTVKGTMNVGGGVKDKTVFKADGDRVVGPTLEVHNRGSEASIKYLNARDNFPWNVGTGGTEDKNFFFWNQTGIVVTITPDGSIIPKGALNVGSGTKNKMVLTVDGDLSASPLVQVCSKGNEASIRYANNDDVPWHAGTGGIGGPKNFFFWNQTNGAVVTITPEGNLTIKGNLVVNGGLSMPRTIVTAVFNETHSNNTTQSIVVGFQPKFISMEGRAHAWLGKKDAYFSYGGAIGGFCHVSDLPDVVRASGHGPYIYRFPDPPYIGFYNELHGVTKTTNAICSANFIDHAMNPKLHVYLEVYVESITSTGFSLKWSYKTDSGLVPPDKFGMDMAFAVLG
jgi:hypothetical protein